MTICSYKPPGQCHNRAIQFIVMIGTMENRRQYHAICKHHKVSDHHFGANHKTFTLHEITEDEYNVAMIHEA